MIVRLNLASQPFRRERPVLIAAIALSTVLVGLLGMLIWMILDERNQLAETRRIIDRLERELSGVAAEQAKLDAFQRQPENAQVLERSVFLNSLLFRKAISWTRIFADLEQTLPHNVRVVSIRPLLNSSNEVVLEMSVGAETTEPVINLLQHLESSQTFGATSVSSRLPPSQSDPLFKYRVNVSYAQRF